MAGRKSTPKAPWIICPLCKGEGHRDVLGVVDMDEIACRRNLNPNPGSPCR